MDARYALKQLASKVQQLEPIIHHDPQRLTRPAVLPLALSTTIPRRVPLRPVASLTLGH